VATAPRIPFSRNALVSYHYWRNRDISALAGFTLIADSGAFSADTQGAVITLADLCALRLGGGAGCDRRSGGVAPQLGADAEPWGQCCVHRALASAAADH
jgi:hypothetical protein